MSTDEMKRIPAVVSLVLFPAYAAVCQVQTPTQVPGFEVASIKVASPAGGGSQIGVSPVRGGDAGQTVVTGNSVPLEALARLLSKRVGRVVVEMTNLKGDYDFKMSFAPDMGPQSGSSGDGTDQPAVDAGFRLEAQKGPRSKV